MKRNKLLAMAMPALLLSGCAALGPSSDAGIRPAFNFPVTNNDTPYTQCLKNLAQNKKANNLPTFAIGEIADKTGQLSVDDAGNANGRALTQGVSEMMISALAKTRMANQVERLDLRIPLAEVKLAEQKRLTRSIESYNKIPASDFIVIGALTELNYNIISGGTQLFVKGIGGGGRMVVINVALDLRVVDSRNFSVRYVSSLQKQIYGYEVEANVFRFFGDTLIEFDSGMIRNDPLQLGVRSVVEMATYQIMTDFLGLPAENSCNLVETDDMAEYLEQLQPKTRVKQTKGEKNEN